MLFEDVHWSDPTFIELLQLIVDRAVLLRLLLIITFRPEFTAPWTGSPHVSLLSLNRLLPREQGAIITGVTGGKSLPKEVAEQIIDRTDGVPLFVGTDQDGDRERHANRLGRPLRCGGSATITGDSGDPSRVVARPAGSHGTGARGRAGWRRAGPAILARADQHHRSHAAAAA
jgi:hypothetical protein